VKDEVSSSVWSTRLTEWTYSDDCHGDVDSIDSHHSKRDVLKIYLRIDEDTRRVEEHLQQHTWHTYSSTPGTSTVSDIQLNDGHTFPILFYQILLSEKTDSLNLIRSDFGNVSHKLETTNNWQDLFWDLKLHDPTLSIFMKQQYSTLKRGDKLVNMSSCFLTQSRVCRPIWRTDGWTDVTEFLPNLHCIVRKTRDEIQQNMSKIQKRF